MDHITLNSNNTSYILCCSGQENIRADIYGNNNKITQITEYDMPHNSILLDESNINKICGNNNTIYIVIYHDAPININLMIYGNNNNVDRRLSGNVSLIICGNNNNTLTNRDVIYEGNVSNDSSNSIVTRRNIKAPTGLRAYTGYIIFMLCIFPSLVYKIMNYFS
jgi:hypothetical protein